MAGCRHDTEALPETNSVFTEPAFAAGLRRLASDRRCSRCSDLRLVFRGNRRGRISWRPDCAGRSTSRGLVSSARLSDHHSNCEDNFILRLGCLADGCFRWPSAILGLAPRLLNASLVAFVMLGGSTLNVVLKHFFHRERPALENPLVTLTSYGFPSGHTMGATLFYGLLALLAWKNVRNRAARLACVVGACFWILLIGLTRIYLGAHYLTDVLGALAAGLFWLVVCWTAFETLRWRRDSTRR
jgi:hypothetical protein